MAVGEGVVFAEVIEGGGLVGEGVLTPDSEEERTNLNGKVAGAHACDLTVPSLLVLKSCAHSLLLPGGGDIHVCVGVAGSDPEEEAIYFDPERERIKTGD